MRNLIEFITESSNTITISKSELMKYIEPIVTAVYNDGSVTLSCKTKNLKDNTKEANLMLDIARYMYDNKIIATKEYNSN